MTGRPDDAAGRPGDDEHGRPAATPDARGVDAFLDHQATGPDIYDPDYAPPARPDWRDLTTYMKEQPCPSTSTPTPPA